MSRSTNNRRDEREFSRLKEAVDVGNSQLNEPTYNILPTPRALLDREYDDNERPGTSRSSEPIQQNEIPELDEQNPPVADHDGQFVLQDVLNDAAAIDGFLRENDEENDITDSENESEEEQTEFSDIASAYITWVTKYNISGIAADEFLNYLRDNHFSFLPKTIKTLRSKAYTIEAPIREMGDGRFLYFGIKNIVNRFIDIANINVQLVQHFKIGFGIDGVPLAKSSKSCFWPILIRFNEYPAVLPVAVFHGRSKPHSIDDYLMEFSDELREILSEGMVRNGVQLNFSIGPLVFDAQAKCFVHDIIAPTGFNACPKCFVQGEKINHRMVFPNLLAPLRTDDSFLNMDDPIHRSTSLPPLARIGINCISETAIDYMHLSCQGVLKTLMNFWINTTSQPYSLNREQKAEINYRILMIRRQLVSDFVRKPRTLDEFSHYKATEFRQILLYTGPFLFKNVLKQQYFDHFMLLCAGHRILCHPKNCTVQNEQAEDYLIQFVNDFKHLYGAQFLVYNFHVLIHLARECIHFQQPLDYFSAFSYENFLQKIIKMLKRAPLPLEQFRNRVQEQFSFRPDLFTKVHRKKNRTVRIPGTDEYEELFTEECLYLTVESNDSFILNDNEIFQIQNINKHGAHFVLTCRKIEGLLSFYGNSSTYGLYFCSELIFSNELTQLNASECSKVQRLCINDVYMLIPMLHSE